MHYLYSICSNVICKCINDVVDELIRQVTINCAERGLLLLRVRDEIRMTIAAYQTLYESSVAFGMRKALQAEQGKADMERKVKKLPLDRFYLYKIIYLDAITYKIHLPKSKIRLIDPQMCSVA